MPQRLDEEYVNRHTGQKPVKGEHHLIVQDETVSVPAEMISRLIHKVTDVGYNGQTKKTLLSSTAKAAKKQTGKRVVLAPFNQEEWQRTLDEIITLAENNPENLTREAWEWKRDAIIASFLDRTGLSDFDLRVGTCAFPETLQMSKEYAVEQMGGPWRGDWVSFPNSGHEKPRISAERALRGMGSAREKFYPTPRLDLAFNARATTFRRTIDAKELL